MHFVVPGPLDQRTGGYLYDKRIVEGLRAQGRAVTVHELAGRFPLVDGAACEAAAAAIDGMAGGLPVIDGLALPAFAEPARPAAARRGSRWSIIRWRSRAGCRQTRWRRWPGSSAGFCPWRAA